MKLLNVTYDETSGSSFNSPLFLGDYPASGLSDGIRNTNCTGNVLINQDGDKYVEAWILSTGQGIAYYYTGNVPDSGLKPFSPTVNASETSIAMSAITGESTTKTITVSGSSLKGDISLELSGADADMFSVTPETIAMSETSAQVIITYEPTEVATHNAILTISSPEATDVVVTLIGTSVEDVVFNDDIKSLDEIWLYSETRGNLANAAWFSQKTAPVTRSMVYNDGKLYVLNATPWNASASIVILDAYSGLPTGKQLDITGVAGGAGIASSLNVIGGKVILANTPSTSVGLKVYKWEDDNSVPVLWHEDATLLGRHDMLSVSGDLNNGRLWVSDASTVSYYTVSNGTVSASASTITLSEALTNQNGAIDVDYNEDGSFWVNAYDSYPTRFDASGKKIEAFGYSAYQGAYRGRSAEFINFGNKKYLADVTYIADDGVVSNGNGALAFMNITDGVDAAANAGVYPSTGLGTTSNGIGLSSVCHEIADGGKTLNVWVLVPYQGIAMYQHKAVSSSVENVADKLNKTNVYVSNKVINVCDVTAKQVEVYSMMGGLTINAQNTNNVDASALASGIYIVVVTDNAGNVTTHKIML